MHTLTIDGKTIELERTFSTQPQIDPLAWLNAQSLYPKVFWKEKEENVIRVAVGASHIFSHIPSLSATTDPQIRCYGGQSFNPKSIKPSVWNSFAQSHFWLPQIELTCTQDSTQIQIYGPPIKPIEELSLLKKSSSSFLNRVDVPNKQDWIHLVENTLQAIRSHQLDKLVLARQTSWELSHPLSPWQLLSELDPYQNKSTLFAFQMNPFETFLGATPELLFKRKGLNVTTEAIAGTRIRGSSSQEEERLEKELLASNKDRREFNYVKQAIVDIFLPWAKTLSWEEVDRVIKTSSLQHLYNRLTILLKKPLSDALLVKWLHPTPALGGYPKEKALSLLKQIEPFDRGWYGAPIGVISSETSAFYVAIRSALIQQHKIHLFTGLGIVEGSCPEKEWEELNAKMHWLIPSP